MGGLKALCWTSVDRQKENVETYVRADGMLTTLVPSTLQTEPYKDTRA